MYPVIGFFFKIKIIFSDKPFDYYLLSFNIGCSVLPTTTEGGNITLTCDVHNL